MSAPLDEAAGAPVPVLAPLWRRLASAFYDALLLVALWMSATLLGSMALTLAGLKYSPGLFRGWLFLVGLAYFGACWVHGGQTLGMRVWRLTAQRAGGAPLNWPAAALRYSLAYLGWLSVVGVLWSAFDRRHRTLHEIASGSETVYRPKLRDSGTPFVG
jgi:uncharacterized RDD family membrane protein YckC